MFWEVSAPEQAILKKKYQQLPMDSRLPANIIHGAEAWNA